MVSKENKEWVLNIAFNRWQLNRPRYVGQLAEAIRACSPTSLEEWQEYYFSNVKPTGVLFGTTMEQHLVEVGRRLHMKISGQLHAEVSAITEEDCINYVRDVVLRRTYDGYCTEKQIVHQQLEEQLGVRLEPAPDEWDRKYNVDYFIAVAEGKQIGIQIKPTTYTQAPEPHRWRQWMQESHKRFEEEQGGKVFIVFSVRKGNEKEIANREIVEEIAKEIKRLQQE
ncbi:MAG: MjaI family restriction endonuclease [Candidatus Kapabacteria bacterium]|nr:MjaI family restriction endonuclease [Candidatus Kapabacteria bacterium]